MNTFVKLPTGDVEIDHIREMVEEVRGKTFEFKPWFPRPGLRDIRSNFVTHLYRGQKFDAKSFVLDETGWTDDHCIICFKTLGSNPNIYTDVTGYFDGDDWICSSCFTGRVLANDLEMKLKEFGQYQQ